MLHRPLHYPESWPKADAEGHLLACIGPDPTASNHARLVFPLTCLRATYLIANTKPRRLLDIGCADCAVLARAVGDYETPEGVVAIDPYFYPRYGLPGVFHFGILDMHEMAKSVLGDFDLILATHVGYRTHDLGRFLACVADVLRPEGCAYVDFWCNEITAACGDSAAFLATSNTQNLHPRVLPKPYPDEVAQVRQAAASVGLCCTELPFFGRRALSAAYRNYPQPDSEVLLDEVAVDILVNDPVDAQTACGYFTAALWKEK